jgi:hypothetical protein
VQIFFIVGRIPAENGWRIEILIPGYSYFISPLIEFFAERRCPSDGHPGQVNKRKNFCIFRFREVNDEKIFRDYTFYLIY